MLATKDGYIIEVAAAGFDKSELSITQTNNTLTIKGENLNKENEKREFIHKGLAERNFIKEFKIAKDLEITDTTLKNGILKVVLKSNKIEPEIKHFQIN